VTRLVAQSRPGTTRAALSKDRVLRAAVSLADEGGIAALTMRRLARELEVEAMSLYHHVADKDQVLDGMVDVVVGEITAGVRDGGASSDGAGWKAAVRHRILAARQVLLRHPWAPGVIESRTTMSPTVLRYFDSLTGLLLGGGLSADLAHHALHALGSRALGFSQELFDPAAGAGDESERMLEDYADRLPNLVGMLTEIAHDDPDNTLGWCDDQAEFEFALDLILDGLERLNS